MTDNAPPHLGRTARGDDATSHVKMVLIGAGVAIVGLAVAAGLAALVYWVGVPEGKRLVAAVAAAGILVAVAVGAWVGTAPRGSLRDGGLVAVVALGGVLLAAWPVAGPAADFRSVAIALDWIDAPNLGTGPTEALHGLQETQADRGDGSGDLLSTAESRVIEAGISLGVLALAGIAAGVLGAALHRREPVQSRFWMVGRQARPAIVLLVAGVALLVGLASPSVWATVSGIVDFDQSAGPEIGVSLSEVVGHPEAMWGETVTVSAAVQRLIGPHAVVIGSNAPMVGSTLLIVSDRPLREHILLPDRSGAGLAAGDVVQVTGTVRQRDATGLDEDLRGVLGELRAEDYQGQAVLVVEAIDKDVPVAAEAGDPEGIARGTAAYDTGVTIDDIVLHPEAHVGLTVTVSGEVEEPILTPHVFVLSGRPLLVISSEARPELFVETTAYVTGEVRMFHLAAAEQELGLDLDDAAMRPYEGQPFIVAESVTLVT